ncbi:hypothetical protein [Methanooceanicella nereidis]|uniref:hypothetical protein n=1 Tax=Methanooceanicella nereidis TaxID=2052831 RepID=UPI001E5E4885|nr:hypothetical protein [Methanocella sp. CWC-04]
MMTYRNDIVSRECDLIKCPYCFPGLNVFGKQKGFCGMVRSLLDVGCPLSNDHKH